MPLQCARALPRAINESGLQTFIQSIATFEELTPSEQKLWNSFETDQIYRLLTGEPDTVPEFRFNWYTVAVSYTHLTLPTIYSV